MPHALKTNALLTAPSLAASLRALHVWSGRSYLPDLVHFVDLLEDSDFVCDMWADEKANPDPVAEFPYPKTGGGVRALTVVSARDHVRLRVAAGIVATATDAKLSRTVYSSRLGLRPPAWAFKTQAYRKFRYAAARDCRAWNCDGMVRTDVRSYYPTIP